MLLQLVHFVLGVNNTSTKCDAQDCQLYSADKWSRKSPNTLICRFTLCNSSFSAMACKETSISIQKFLFLSKVDPRDPVVFPSIHFSVSFPWNLFFSSVVF
ncbi:hypothetical protein FKM82_011182 [Ascaphus truei]